MPRSGGIYTLPPTYNAIPGTTIRAEQHNAPLEDLAAAMNGVLARDGSTPMQGNLPMNGRKVTGLGAATAPSDAPRLDQVIANTGWMQALAGLTMAADRLPYATGADTASYTPLTQYARSLLNDTSPAEARGTLGLGTLSTKDAVSVGDITATGSAGSTTFLRGDGSWSDPTGQIITSSALTLPAGNSGTTWTHGLTTRPPIDRCGAYLVWRGGAVGGFANGDILRVSSNFDDDNSGFSFVIGETELKIGLRGAPSGKYPNGSGVFTLTSSNVDLYFWVRR